MTWLIGLLLRTGLSERAARAIAILLIVGAIIAGAVFVAGTIKGCVEERSEQAVTLDRAEMNAEAARRARAADEAVAVNRAERSATITNQQMEARGEAEKHGSDDAVGPGLRATLERVRQQQFAARRN